MSVDRFDLISSETLPPLFASTWLTLLSAEFADEKNISLDFSSPELGQLGMLLSPKHSSAQVSGEPEQALTYRLEGTLREVGEILQVRAVLRSARQNTDEQNTYPIELVLIDVRNLDQGVEKFAEILVETLYVAAREEAQFRTRRLAVICPEIDQGGLGADQLPAKLKQWHQSLTKSLIRALSDQANLVVLDWSDVRKYCDSRASVSALADEFQVDAIVSGHIGVDSEGMPTLQPWIYINELRMPINVGSSIELESTDYDPAYVLIEAIVDFLSGILLADGRWRINDAGPLAASDAPSTSDQGFNDKEVSAQASTLYHGGDLSGAATLFQLVLGRNPDDVNALTRLGQIRADQGRTTDAVMLLQHAVEVDPHAYEAQLLLARVFANVGDIGPAIEQFERVAEATAAPTQTRVEASVGSGRLAAVSDQVDEAYGAYERALKLDSNSVEALLGLAELKSLQHDWSEALALLERAGQVSEGDKRVESATANALYSKGQDELESGSHTEAIWTFRRLADLAPTTSAYHFLGYSYFRRAEVRGVQHEESRSDLIASIDAFSKVRELGVKGDPYDLYSLSSLNLIEAYILTRRYDDAVGLGGELLGTVPDVRTDARLLIEFLVFSAALLSGEGYVKYFDALHQDILKLSADGFAPSYYWERVEFEKFIDDALPTADKRRDYFQKAMASLEGLIE